MTTGKTIALTRWTFVDEKYQVDKAQAGIKIAGRNINNLRYADDTTLMAESEEELKSLIMKVKEDSEKVVLKHKAQFLSKQNVYNDLHSSFSS